VDNLSPELIPISIGDNVLVPCINVQAGMIVCTRTALPKNLKGSKILNVGDHHISFDILCTYVGDTKQTVTGSGGLRNSSPLVLYEHRLMTKLC